MSTNKICDVQWDGAHSNMFKIFNGVKHGSAISPFLFTLYIDSLFSLLKQLGISGHAGEVGYADDIALVAPSRYPLYKENIIVRKSYADKYCSIIQ